jgi:hypothetical protein
MPCEEGQKLQDEFDKAIAARIRIESRGPRSAEAKDARVAEAIALKKRSTHFRKCFNCWRDRPRRHFGGVISRARGTVPRVIA